MHAEPPLHTPSSWREFALHVLMIVVSVLIALGIEEGVQALHNRSNAAKARVQIEAELRSNLKETREALAANRARLKDMLEWKARVLAAARGEGSHAAAPGSPPSVSLQWPSFAHEAWDVAVANRAVAYLPADVQRRFSAAYTLQRDAGAAAQSASAVLLGSPLALNAIVDLELGKAQPIDQLRLVSLAITTQSSVQGALRQAEEQLAKALDEPAPH